MASRASPPSPPARRAGHTHPRPPQHAGARGRASVGPAPSSPTASLIPAGRRPALLEDRAEPRVQQADRCARSRAALDAWALGWRALGQVRSLPAEAGGVVEEASAHLAVLEGRGK